MYEEIVHHLVENFKKLEANMRIMLHYLHNHLEHFPENLDEQGERFHQAISEMESRYQGR